MPVRHPESSLARALGRIPSGLFILTLRHGEAATGVLLSWVQQCGFSPPGVTFCVQTNRFHLDWLRAGAQACLHILGLDSGKPLLKHFAAGFGPEANAFADIPHWNEPGKPPLLPEALAWLHLRPTSFVPAGDHTLVVCEVTDGSLQSEGDPWVHLRKNGLTY